MEKLLDDDVRIKNARVRLEEQGRRWTAEGAGDSAKLKDIEDAAMAEDDLEKLKALFEECREEYLKRRAAND